jgi:hypothetical protein
MLTYSLAPFNMTDKEKNLVPLCSKILSKVILDDVERRELQLEMN